MGFAKNTAVPGFTFLLINSGTGVVETGKTVTASIVKDGGPSAIATNAVDEIGGGLYSLDITAAEANCDTFTLLFTATDCVPVSFVIKTDLPGVVGNGSTLYPVTCNDINGVPISGVECWITIAADAGSRVVAGTKVTDDFGYTFFMLDSGTYYLWRDSAYYNFDNPKTVVIA
jgi:hypothetical protein